MEAGDVGYEGDGLAGYVVLDEFVGAAEAVSSGHEGLGSAGAEVHVAGVNIVIDSRDVIGRIVRDPENGDDGFAGCGS